MALETSIEWTDLTWNPMDGCTKVSKGCLNCYIARTPPFRMAHRKFDQPGIGGTTGVNLYPERLSAPYRPGPTRCRPRCWPAPGTRLATPTRFASARSKPAGYWTDRPGINIRSRPSLGR